MCWPWDHKWEKDIINITRHPLATNKSIQSEGLVYILRCRKCGDVKEKVMKMGAG